MHACPRSILPVLTAILLALSLAACREKSPPTAPTSNLPPAPARAAPNARLVVLSPALGVICKDLGLDERIVGRHAFDIVLDKSLPVCGDQQGIDYEALLAARPTDILLEWGSRPIPERLIALAREQQWAVRNFSMLSIADVIATTDDIDAVFRRQSSPALCGTSGAEPPPFGYWIEEALKPRRGLEKAGRILLLESLNPPAALGPGSSHHELLTRLGAIPAITSGKPYITLDAEAILALKPDGIILFAPRPYGFPARPRSPEEVRELLGRIGTLDIPAVRDRHLALVDHPLCLLPSTALIDTARETAAILESWAK